MRRHRGWFGGNKSDLGIRRIERHAVIDEHAAQAANRGKDFLVAIFALIIERGLLEFADPAILGENPVRKPHDRGP